ncbi:hypothetical protein CDD80_2652 [Ophiocordyceps camponoti-rufipedis]|uniref:Heme haloperoxidase family profile domain-containing protein n=1 Tax=Ophiocordyceps camponoti-rufipedis TaxID=2004952 RepID=A0A2C5Z220_9HYPO|nr:hypothetical protein CDD80_2652 [Ophiocordyceps camponoti-rufipedis]
MIQVDQQPEQQSSNFVGQQQVDAHTGGQDSLSEQNAPISPDALNTRSPSTQNPQAPVEQRPSTQKKRAKFDIQDKRFLTHKPAQPGESRSSCPAMNALANHEFLPHNGKGITLEDVITACFEGFGASPEACGFICLAGMVNARLRLTDTFDLAQISEPDWKIEHDASLTRADASQQRDLSRFDAATWNVTLNVLGSAEFVSALKLGKAKSVRVRDAKNKNPKSVYDSRTASRSVTEIALLTSVLGNIDGWAKLDFIRSLFEKEKLPWGLGWRPRLHDADLPSILGIGALTLNADPELLSVTSDGAVLTPQDIVKATSVKDKASMAEFRNLIRRMGLNTVALEALFERLGTGR